MFYCLFNNSALLKAASLSTYLFLCEAYLPRCMIIGPSCLSFHFQIVISLKKRWRICITIFSGHVSERLVFAGDLFPACGWYTVGLANQIYSNFIETSPTGKKEKGSLDLSVTWMLNTFFYDQIELKLEVLRSEANCYLRSRLIFSLADFKDYFQCNQTDILPGEEQMVYLLRDSVTQVKKGLFWQHFFLLLWIGAVFLLTHALLSIFTASSFMASL